MSAPDDGGPAFPSGKSEKTGYENTLPYYEGMTLRDWFAGQALAGMMAYQNSSRGDFHTNCDDETIAKTTYAYADAMLTARNNLP